MQITKSFYIQNDKQNKEVFDQLNIWSKVSKNLYNQGLYLIKRHYELNKNEPWYKPLTNVDLDSILKETINLEGNINYRMLPAVTSQQILRILDKNIKSFYKSIKDWKVYPNKYLGKPNFPKFLRKDKNLLAFTNQQVAIKNSYLQITKNCKIFIPFNTNEIKKFDYIRILPVTRSRFKVEIIYTYLENELLPDNNKYLGIDLGINNFATCVTNIDKKPLIFNGKLIKSYNVWYNKRKSFLQSKLQKNHYNSKQLEELEFKRFCKINDIFHLYSKRIIDYCLNNEINTIIIGHNKSWKQNINIGSINNQKFTSIPYNKFINQLKYKCIKYGINFIETEESYTSKVDHLANESMENHGDSYSGKRIRRGLFQSSVGKIINADVNGSIGIIRKVIPQVVGDVLLKEIINSGQLFCPIRLNTYRIKNISYFDNLSL